MLECEHFCILSTSSCQIDDIQYNTNILDIIWWKKRSSLNMVTCLSKFLIFMPQRLYKDQHYCFWNFCLSFWAIHVYVYFQGLKKRRNCNVILQCWIKIRFIWILCSYYCENFFFVKRSNWSKQNFIIIFLFRTWFNSCI